MNLYMQRKSPKGGSGRGPDRKTAGLIDHGHVRWAMEGGQEALTGEGDFRVG